MSQPEFVEPARAAIDEAVESKTLDESSELAQRRGSFVEIDEMRPDSSLGEKAQGLSRVGALLYAKDLNFHRLRRAVIDRGHLRPPEWPSCRPILFTDQASIPTAPRGGYPARTRRRCGESSFGGAIHTVPGWNGGKHRMVTLSTCIA